MKFNIISSSSKFFFFNRPPSLTAIALKNQNERTYHLLLKHVINFTIQSNYGIRHLNPKIQASNIEIFQVLRILAPPGFTKNQMSISHQKQTRKQPSTAADTKKKKLKITGASAVHDFAREISELAKSK